ncbi:hypothetical protein, partial [Halorubrum distributum]|uniref:hypothetical protein n=1 Tax=Halorubrum distributum TaxID=29283 RepID=UPI0019553DDD
NSTANPDEKRSNTLSKRLSEINNVLHKSEPTKQSLVWNPAISRVLGISQRQLAIGIIRRQLLEVSR